MKKNNLGTSSKDPKDKNEKKIETIHQGKTVSDFYDNPWYEGITYKYMNPIFDYL